MKSNQIGPKLFPNYGVLKGGGRLMSLWVWGVGCGVGGLVITFLLSVYYLFYCEHNKRNITRIFCLHYYGIFFHYWKLNRK